MTLSLRTNEVKWGEIIAAFLSKNFVEQKMFPKLIIWTKYFRFWQALTISIDVLWREIAYVCPTGMCFFGAISYFLDMDS